jgi:signal peptidase I
LADLVKGGRHFSLAIDVESGNATLSIPGLEGWKRTAATAVRGAGKHRLMFANVDRQLLVWIDDKLVEFDQPATYDDLANDHPQSSAEDGGDLAPVGIGARGAKLSVTHLRVLRDVYYIADQAGNHHLYGPTITDYAGHSGIPSLAPDSLARFFSHPEHWSGGRAGNVFDTRRDVTFDLGPSQYFVLGDNSPASSDARFWSHGPYVDRDLLVGKALLVYWPHPWGVPIPMTGMEIPIVPYFTRMGFIR